ncbi:MAG: hemin-degrading factor [Pseudorhodobacter sp.]
MSEMLSAAEIRAARENADGKRDRDLAASLGISEAQLVAARIGHGATRIAHSPDTVMPLLKELGDVLALTRNDACVHERVGTFEDYRSGPHAAMVLGKEIDTRIFPKHWGFGFALEEETPRGLRRSLQFFDLAGDALQKVYLREGSHEEAWAPLVEKLATGDSSDRIEVAPRPPVEGPRTNSAKRDVLVEEWKRMTDTHQFNRLTSKLGMNRLGAYHLAGHPFARAVDPGAVPAFFEKTAEAGQKVIYFVGNRGNIQIHWGLFENIKTVGPWLNVLDDRFHMHLRAGDVAELYVIDKPTKRGPAVSLEAFDAEGGLIFQCFGQRESEDDELARWHDILDGLPARREAAE